MESFSASLSNRPAKQLVFLLLWKGSVVDFLHLLAGNKIITVREDKMAEEIALQAGKAQVAANRHF